MLPFPMPRSIPDKTHYIAPPDHHYSLSTAHYPLFSTLCFHNLTNPSSRLPAHIDFYFHHFHALTNPFSGKTFVFTSIQNPRGVTHDYSSNFRFSRREMSQAFCFYTVATSFSLPRKSSALESATSTLFSKNTRGIGTPGRSLRTQAWTVGVTRVEKIGEQPALWEGLHRRCG